MSCASCGKTMWNALMCQWCGTRPTTSEGETMDGWWEAEGEKLERVVGDDGTEYYIPMRILKGRRRREPDGPKTLLEVFTGEKPPNDL